MKKLLRLNEVRSRVPYSRATIYRLVAEGRFPRSYHLGGKAVFWLEAETDAWISEHVATSGAAEGQLCH
jgi:prophage regulatory protein